MTTFILKPGCNGVTCGKSESGIRAEEDGYNIKSMAFKPKVLVGSVFGESYPLTVYVTDDANRLPIYAKASILIGTVKFELVEYKNLRNPITSKYK